MVIRRLSAVSDGDELDDGRESGAAESTSGAAGSTSGAAGSTSGAAELLRRTALGDSAAFEQLYDEFAPRVYGIALRVVRNPDQSKEVAQEAFLDVWRRASRFDPAKGSAAGWILALAHSRAVDRVRSVQAEADREVRDGIASPQRDVDVVSETVERRWEQEAVRRCLSTLTELQRQSVTLAYYSGYTYPQVAALLNAELPTVKTRIRDGLIRLRDCLGVSR